MSRRLFLIRSALALTVGMLFVASTTQATALNGANSAAVAQGTVDPYFQLLPPLDATRVSTTLSGIVSTPRLRVRDAATFRGKIIGHLDEGQIVTILGIHLNRRWLKIRTGDGLVGWVSVFYVRLVGGELKLLAFVE